MSKANAKKFFDLAEKDKKVQEKLKKNFKDVQAMAKRRGYKFTRAELHDHLRERWGISKPPEVDEVDTCTIL